MSEFLSFQNRIAARACSNYIPPNFRAQRDEVEQGAKRYSYQQLLNRILLCAPQTWFVEGVAGSGKTSLAIGLACDCLDNDLACVFVDRTSLRQGFKTDGDLRDFAKDARPAEIDAALWKSRVKHHKCVFIVDAVNELRREFLGTTQWDFVRRVLESGHGYPVLATSRYEHEGSDTLFRQWNALTLAPLNEGEIAGYLTARGLEASHAIHEIEAFGLDGASWNPFFLSLLADLLVEKQASGKTSLPRSRAELLRATVNRSRRLTEGEMALSQRGLSLETALCATSLTAFLSKGQASANLQSRDLVALLERVWHGGNGVAQLARAFLDTQMVERSGDDGSTVSYRLLHPSLMDFGLALGWRNQVPGTMVRDPLFLDQCLGDWVGLQNDPNQAIRDLLRPENSLPSPGILIDVVISNRGVLYDETQGMLWQAIGKGFNGPRAIRDDLARTLEKLPPHIIREGTRYGLFRKLRHHKPDLADKTQEALWNGSLSPLNYQRLRRKHHRIEQDEPRAFAGRITLLSSAELEIQIQFLESDADPDHRRRSANWLGYHGARKGVPALLGALEKETDDRTKGAIVTALGQIGDRAAVEALAAALSDPNAEPKIRGSAANALGQIGDRAAVEALAAALSDPNAEPNIRGSAANALGQIGDRAAVEALAAALSDQTARSDIRGSAANALGQIGDRAAVEALAAALSDPNAEPKIRGSAANALGQIGDRAAVEALAAALSDPNAEPKIRGSAANALGQIGDRAAVEALAAALSDPNAEPKIRGSAANALGQIGDRAAVEALAAALSDPNAEPNIRGSAANALGQIGDRAAVEALAAALSDQTARSDIRGSAANALGQIGDRAAVEALAAALSDPNAEPKIRGSAANALGQIGDRAAVEALAAALSDPNAEPKIRGSAANALGQIGDRAAVEALAAALSDPNAEPNIRGSAANALGQIGDRAAVEPLVECIKSDSQSYWVRSSAVFALAVLPAVDCGWLMEIADIARQCGGNDKDAKKFRGAIVNVLSHNISDNQERNWLSNLARHDPDPINRTAAVRGLSKAGQIGEELIRYLIDPDVMRTNGKLSDTDNGVCGEAAAAVIRMTAYDQASASRLMKPLVALLSRIETWSSVHKAALAPLLSLPLDTSEQILRAIGTELAAIPEPNPHFTAAVARYSELLEQKRWSAQEYKELSNKPESMLMNFVKESTSPFQVSDTSANADRFDIGLLTAIPVETRAVVEELRRQGIPVMTIQRKGRYFDSFELAGDDRPVRVVFTQATDKGGQSANTATHDIIAEFHPDLIVLVGVAGGFGERKVNLYDLIVAKTIFNYDPERIQPSGDGSRPQVYRTDEQFLRLVQYLETHGELTSILAGGKLHQKDYASGEKVLAWREAPIRRQLLGLSTDIYGVETEGHGVMHTIWETFKADHFVGGAMIKCVSDLGDEDMATDKDAKQRHAATKAAEAALAIIRQFRRA